MTLKTIPIVLCSAFSVLIRFRLGISSPEGIVEINVDFEIVVDIINCSLAQIVLPFLIVLYQSFIQVLTQAGNC